MTEHVVASTDELEPGDRIVVQIENREIGVFNVDGEYYACTNWCAHQAGPLCEGPITGTREACFDDDSLTVDFEWVKEGKILNCPWHGWEFDVTTGECLSRRSVSVPTHPVTVGDGDIIVTL